MIKNIIFDLDGVLFEGAELHKICFLKALQSILGETFISEEYHDKHLNGLSTKQKLNLLLERSIITEDQANCIEQKKKEHTLEAVKQTVIPSLRIKKLLSRLSNDEYQLFCVTNSIKSTTLLVLEQLEILEYFKSIITNEDIKNPKPSPEPYQTLMQSQNLDPFECLILEDSQVGRTAAFKSGAHVLQIVDPHDVTYENITAKIYSITHCNDAKDLVVNIVVPMAGHGSRFSKKGYTIPKPFIPVFNKPMIQWVIENIIPTDEVYDFIKVPCKIKPVFHFVAQAEHLKHYDLGGICKAKGIEYTISTVDKVTEGPACTVLLTKQYINNDTPLITINSDQFLDWDINNFYRSLLNPSYDGCINTFFQPDPNDIKWSYAKVDENGIVTEVAEKKYISNLATTGIYGWKRGSDFVREAERMIEANDRVNNEFYVAPVYNYLVEKGGKVRTFNCKKLWGLGVPEDLEYFIKYYGN